MRQKGVLVKYEKYGTLSIYCQHFPIFSIFSIFQFLAFSYFYHLIIKFLFIQIDLSFFNHIIMSQKIYFFRLKNFSDRKKITSGKGKKYFFVKIRFMSPDFPVYQNIKQ